MLRLGIPVLLDHDGRGADGAQVDRGHLAVHVFHVVGVVHVIHGLLRLVGLVGGFRFGVGGLLGGLLRLGGFIRATAGGGHEPEGQEQRQQAM